ncbi:MAG TPA: hypothetical protein VKM94_17370 [Blastocatellia bacterium]|nr:hypothetical protein [Blastocatellia bacterium]
MSLSSGKPPRLRPLHRWVVSLLGWIVPRRIRKDWRQEWEAELGSRKAVLWKWQKLDWRGRADLLRRSLGALRDALFLQPRRLEDEILQDVRYGVRDKSRSDGRDSIRVAKPRRLVRRGLRASGSV